MGPRGVPPRAWLCVAWLLLSATAICRAQSVGGEVVGQEVVADGVSADLRYTAALSGENAAQDDVVYVYYVGDAAGDNFAGTVWRSDGTRAGTATTPVVGGAVVSEVRGVVNVRADTALLAGRTADGHALFVLHEDAPEPTVLDSAFLAYSTTDVAALDDGARALLHARGDGGDVLLAVDVDARTVRTLLSAPAHQMATPVRVDDERALVLVEPASTRRRAPRALAQAATFAELHASDGTTAWRLMRAPAGTQFVDVLPLDGGDVLVALLLRGAVLELWRVDMGDSEEDTVGTLVHARADVRGRVGVLRAEGVAVWVRGDGHVYRSDGTATGTRALVEDTGAPMRVVAATHTHVVWQRTDTGAAWAYDGEHVGALTWAARAGGACVLHEDMAVPVNALLFAVCADEAARDAVWQFAAHHFTVTAEDGTESDAFELRAVRAAALSAPAHSLAVVGRHGDDAAIFANVRGGDGTHHLVALRTEVELSAAPPPLAAAWAALAATLVAAVLLL